MNRVALYGGTFDPFHAGHLAVARAVRDAGVVDEVRIVPVGSPPHRGQTIATAEERWCMAILSTLQEPGMRVERWETDAAASGPTYAVDTLRRARQVLGQEVSLAWVIGMDALQTLGAWHRLPEILEMAQFLVLPRDGADAITMREILRRDLGQLPAAHFTFVPMPQVPISSSGVREALRRGEDPAPMVSPLVATFLERYDPYRMLRSPVR